MATQSIIWTAMPNGRNQNKELKISVLMSPRLDAEAASPQLSSFADFVDWPQTLTGCQFTLHFNGQSVNVRGDQIRGDARLDTSYGRADSALWGLMFPANTQVKGFVFKDMTAKKVLSYNVAKMALRQALLYRSLALKADDQLPQIASLLSDPAWSSLIDDVISVDRAFGSEAADQMGRDVGRQFTDFIEGFKQSGLKSTQQDWAQFQLFHTPLGAQSSQSYQGLSDKPEKSKTQWRTTKRYPLPTAAQLTTLYDFHQVVAAMNQYPSLLRRLGLVVDFIVAADGFSPSPDGLLRVEVTLPVSRSRKPVTRLNNVSPKVHCRCEAEAFYMLSSQQSQLHQVFIKQGLLDINAEHFALVQHDVDGTGLKAMNTARTLVRQKLDKVRLDPTSRKERSMGIAALRNAGLMLVQKERGLDLEQRFKQAQSLNKKFIVAQQAPLGLQVSQLPHAYAEDLNRGFRFDIWDDTSKVWHSLCRRHSEYIVAGQINLAISDEEGVVRMAASQSADRQINPTIVSLHEMLLSWTGWSLCAAMPGKIVDGDDQVGDQDAEVPAGLPLKSNFKVVPGSLPRLRYGRRYWLRARAVDLAGNSLPPSRQDYGPEQAQQNAQVYLRFDAIKAPVLALYQAKAGNVEGPQEGESMQRMAIRSFNQTPDLNKVASAQTCRRFVLPASSSVKDAEVHGMLDEQGAMDASTFALLVNQDKALKEQKIPSIPAALPDPLRPLGETAYSFFTQGSSLPYLPDPLCIQLAARFFDHPAISDSLIMPIDLYSNTKQWPHALPFNIELLEQSGKAPYFDSKTSTLFVPLAKAERATLRLSVKPDPNALNVLGIWQWLSTLEQRKLKKRALDGQHWMLTPWLEIELVHAVQKPLITPELSLQIYREAKRTWAIPQFSAPLSIKSSDHADLMARWHEPSLLHKNSPEDLSKTDRAFSIKITDPQHYSGKPEHEILKPDLIRAGSKGLKALVDKVHEFEDTRYRRIEYWLEASTRFREYMPAAILTDTVNGKRVLTDKNIKVQSEPVVNWIPSSAPPPAPEILYCVPTFRWVRSVTATKQQSLRRGWGLRVYLDGPWHVSGYGEMLAVILPGDAAVTDDPNTKPTTQPLKNFVTQWGNDPIWLSNFVPGPSPKADDFTSARFAPDPNGAWLPEFAPASEADQPAGNFVVNYLRHPQISDPAGSSASSKLKKLVNIAPHDVFFDNDRKLWFCDIDIKAKSAYYPFIRLALARYQPISVVDNHLSNIVLADFMTLSSNRSVTVTKGDSPSTRSVEVFGTSFSDSSGHQEALHAPQYTISTPDGTRVVKAADVGATTVVEVWVEKLDEKLGEDFGWQVDSSVRVSQATSLTASATPLMASAKVSLLKDQNRALQLVQQNAYQTLLQEDLLKYVIEAPSLWKGTVTLPRGAAGSAQRYRLVIAEYEEYFIDDDAPYNAVPTKKGRRLVFVEHIAW
jgi:hypothetical protein